MPCREARGQKSFEKETENIMRKKRRRRRRRRRKKNCADVSIACKQLIS